VNNIYKSVVISFVIMS